MRTSIDDGGNRRAPTTRARVAGDDRAGRRCSWARLADPDGARREWYVKSGDAGQLDKSVAGSRPADKTAGGEPVICCS